MDYNKIKKQIHSCSPQAFLDNVLCNSNSDDFFSFSKTIDTQFRNNCIYLTSEETISDEDLVNWKKEDFLVVAQTIDGDYIGGMLNQTLIIPVSLHKSDIEYFTLSLCDFFIAYNQGEIQSTILPKNNS